jgi:hypothetical protein
MSRFTSKTAIQAFLMYLEEVPANQNTKKLPKKSNGAIIEEVQQKLSKNCPKVAKIFFIPGKN